MKKIICLFVLLFLISGCNISPTSTTETFTIVNSESNTQNRAFYDDVFEGFGVYTSGMPMSYDETVNALKEYIDSFYLIKTEYALSLSECQNLKGWNENLEDMTVYKITILKDLIKNEDINQETYLLISMGSTSIQNKGDPSYMPGEMFTVAIEHKSENEDFLRSCGSYYFRYDVAESNGIMNAYGRNKSTSDFINNDITVCTLIEHQQITSTTANPANYAQTISLDMLV